MALSGKRSLTDELFNASREGDMKTFDECIGNGVDILCKNNAGWNVLHYIGLYSNYSLLCHVVQHHSKVIQLVNDVDKDGTTPLHMACMPNRPDIRIIEKFVRLGGDLLQRDNEGKACQDKTHDRNTQNFLQWRKLHPSGLPDTVLANQKTANNDVIMKYLHTFGKLDDAFARRYESALKKSVEESANIRVIFLGPQGVGKTTLTYHLLEKALPEDGVDSTNTMDVNLNRLMINKNTHERILLPENDIERTASLNRLRDMLGTLSFSDKNTKSGTSESSKKTHSGDMAYVNIFDFGGEVMFSNFQHIFLNADAVIILLFSLENCMKHDSTDLDTVFYWLKFIYTYSIGKYKPPIVLIGTHLDKIPMDKRTTTLNAIMTTIRSKERDADIAHIFDQHVVDVIHISNPEPRDGVFEKIWHSVMRCAPYQAQWGQLLPGHWIALEHDLMTMKGRGVKVMTLKEIKKHAEAIGVTDVEAFLRYLHSARNVLTFPTDGHQDMSTDLKFILDPEWMIKAFRLIVTDLKYHIRNVGSKDPLLKEYQQTRRLRRAFIDKVWGKEENESFSENSDTLLYYIERSELIVKPLPKEDEMDAEIDTYIVPSMLLDQDGTNVVRSYLQQGNIVTSSTLGIKFDNNFIPDAVFDKFLASLLYRFQVVSHETNQLLWRGLACFILTADVNMVIHCKTNMIKVTLLSQKAFNTTHGVQIRTVLEKLLVDTLQRNDQGHLNYTEHIGNDFEVYSPEGDTFNTTTAVKKFWFGDLEVTQREPAEKCSSTASQNRLTLKEMSRIAKHIHANSYQMFFIQLEMDDTTFNQIRRDNSALDFRSQVIRMLIRWHSVLDSGKQPLELIVDAMNATSIPPRDMLSEVNSPPSFYEELKNVAELTKRTRVPDRCLVEAEVRDLARRIGKMYVVFFIELDITNERIEEAEVDHRGDVLKMKEKLLLEWMERESGDSNVVRIVMAFKECQLDWNAVVDVLKKTS
ncbi:uncharacterized protein LOC132559912 [Ylistrum balloti]|uniref:uncharacterized protein LOC132559912 n=1 Tax=Ylistrum balloti TaxID=509963 RepID=UPI0029058EDF|nr:uncharacterized protein LOC132559912 [Ylistrum balloti]